VRAIADWRGKLAVILQALNGRKQLLGVCGGPGQEEAGYQQELVENAHQAAIIGYGLLRKE
jgi:hypothetical protein